MLSDSDTGSGMSSPLTSLSSLDDLDERVPPIPGPSNFNAEDLKVAQVILLCSLLLLRRFTYITSYCVISRLLPSSMALARK